MYLLITAICVLATGPILCVASDAAVVPPGEGSAKAALDKSPRHGEWVDISVTDSKVPVKSYIVYPERKDKAPIVMVIHEIFGESDWIRSVAEGVAVIFGNLLT